MSLRRFAPVPLLALAFSACNPSVPTAPSSISQANQPTSLAIAAFDPTAVVPVLPQPNDLVLQLTIPNPPPSAEFEFLAYFKSQGGFSYDQELDLTIPFQTIDSASGTPTTPPSLDVKSVRPCTAPSTSATSECNLLVIDTTTGLYPALDAPPSYAIEGSTGTLTVVKSLDPTTQNRLWQPGHLYVYAVRGGPNGVRTTGGGEVGPSTTTFALLFNPPNALPGCGATPPTAACATAQELQASYQPVFATVANKGFPPGEIAVVGTFTIAPASTWVEGDAASGQLPLPSDFLLDPTTGHVNAALDAVIPEISTLDGFSTTAIQLATTSGPVQALTIRDPTKPAQAGVYLYQYLPATGSYVEVQDVVDFLASPSTTLPSYVAQPLPPTNGLVPAVALQPAVAVPLGPVSPTAPGTVPPGQLSLLPLKEQTTYAVVITNRILDAAGKPLSNTTLGHMLMFQNSLCTPSPACAANPSQATSTVPGIPNAQSSGLEKMRLGLKPLFPKLEADHGVTAAQIAMVYTVTTQSILQVMEQLPGIPYQGGGTSIVPLGFTSFTPASAFALYGVDPGFVPGVAPLATPSGTVNPVLAEVIAAEFPTVNLIDPTTGAFYASATSATPLPIQALVAVPDPTKVALPSCPSGPVPFCAPLVVFHHGLGRGNGDVLVVANELAAQGFVVAAIDAPLHGLRSYCNKNSDCVTASGATGTCTPIGPPGTQGDAVTPPGTCTGGSVLAQAPVLCPTPGCQAAWAATPANQRGGIAVASGNYLISANVFRSRDNLRQDVIDVSSLVLALARPPAPTLPPSTTTSPVAVHLATTYGIAVDPRFVFYEGISLGSILGTLNVAANPRFSEGVLDVGGGTIVDIITTSPAFAADADALLPPKGTAAYLQTLLAFKWILDPADPINFAAYVTKNALPSPIGSQPPKQVLGMWAACDNTVPNPTNVELYDNVGLGALSPAASTSVLYTRSVAPDASHPACPLGASAVPHGFLQSWGLSSAGFDQTDADLTLLGQEQAAAFLANPQNLPAPVQVQP